MRKEMLKKIVPGILLISFVVAVIVVIGSKPDSNDMDKQVQITLERLFSCTLQQAEELDAAIFPTEAGTPDGSIGIVPAPDTIAEYFTALFKDCMIEECINDLIANRTFSRCASLAQEYDSDISMNGLELIKRPSVEGLYTFSAKLQTSAGNSVAVAFGTISMEKVGKDWKASKITATVNPQ